MKHNIEALRERFYNLFDRLMNEYALKDAINEGSPEDVEDCWRGLREAESELNIWIGTGCTKFVIGDDNCDYIIKFQPPYIEQDNGEYDYCAREVEVYNQAEVEGFADKFAWCAKLFDYDTEDGVLPVYVMEYCQCSYEAISDDMDDWHYSNYCTSRDIDKSDEAYDKYYNDVKYDREFDERMMEWAYNVWGLDYNAPVEPGVKSIAQFMREMSINDIHCGNWGWCHNKLVLTDYSGFGGDMSYREINY